jgi:PIN domain nuclease of toxin-antitoxin system
LKLLLDTHIWLWSLQDRERLGSRVEKELRDSSNEVWLSPISTWEALLLHFKGRIHLHTDNLERWRGEATAPFREALLTHEIAFAARQLPIPSRDPADRFIAATAWVLGLTLVTADVMLLGLGDIATLANR